MVRGLRTDCLAAAGADGLDGSEPWSIGSDDGADRGVEPSTPSQRSPWSAFGQEPDWSKSVWRHGPAGSALPVRVRRMASRAEMARRRAVSSTERPRSGRHPRDPAAGRHGRQPGDVRGHAEGGRAASARPGDRARPAALRRGGNGDPRADPGRSFREDLPAGVGRVGRRIISAAIPAALATSACLRSAVSTGSPVAWPNARQSRSPKDRGISRWTARSSPAASP